MTEQFQYQRGNLGWIEVICGSMFSGKSEELIRRLRRAEIARQRVQIFKPGIDQRYDTAHIVSHSELKIRSENVKDAAGVMDRLDLRTFTVFGRSRGPEEAATATEWRCAPSVRSCGPRNPRS